MKCELPGHCGTVTMCAYCEIDCRKERDKLRDENLNLREAIRGEREKNGVLSIWLKEEGDKVSTLNLQIDELRRLAKAALATNGGFMTTVPAWQDLQSALMNLTEKRNDEKKDHAYGICREAICDECRKAVVEGCKHGPHEVCSKCDLI